MLVLAYNRVAAYIPCYECAVLYYLRVFLYLFLSFYLSAEPS